jgi:hypothetical protein
MNKIAAYTEALFRIEIEKRASDVAESYRTSVGHLPMPYAVALIEMEKEALLQEAGKATTKALYGLGNFISGGKAGASGSRTGIGGSLMDWSSGISGARGGSATRARFTSINKARRNAGEAPLSMAEFETGRESAQRMVGGAALGATGLGLAGGGYMMGR